MNDDPFAPAAVLDNPPAAMPVVPMPDQPLQRIQGRFATAISVQRPRELQEVEARLMREADVAGESFYYGWSVKDKGGRASRIEGPSIDMAMAMARNWFNCAVDALPVQEVPGAWIFTAAFIDLETGFTATRQFRQSKKWVVHGRLDDERKDDVRFQIGQSKAARNVILRSLPGWLVAKTMQRAKAGVRNRIQKYIDDKGIVAARDIAIKALAKQGATIERVLATLGKPKAEALDIEDLVRLKGDLQALQDGAEDADSLFPAVASEEPENPKRKGKRTLADVGQKIAPGATEAEPKTPAEPEAKPVDREALVKQILTRVMKADPEKAREAQATYKLDAWSTGAVEKLSDNNLMDLAVMLE